MTIVVVGYIKDFKLPCNSDNDVKIIEGVSERIDYIRVNNLEKKESFTLIPKFVTNIVDSGKQITIFIQKIDILSSFRKKRRVKVQFGQVQSNPFYDSRQILVTAQKLKDLFPINVLIINWGSISDTIGYLKSADSQIYDIQSIYIHKKIESDQVTKFLNDHHFLQNNDNDSADYIQFNNKKPNIKSLIFKNPEELLEYKNTTDADNADIFAINWGIQMYLPFDKFFPCKDMTIYYDSKSHSERIKNTILFGNINTMVHLTKVIKDKRVLFLDTLKNEGFILNEF